MDDLRAELSARTLTIDDVDATIAMINACELHDSGEPMWERADLPGDRVGQTIDDERTHVGAMFEANGYTPRHTS
jgi:hypothetical protein